MKKKELGQIEAFNSTAPALLDLHNMRNLLVVLLLVLVLCSALSLQAGEYHHGSTLFCADCHTMHNSMSHQWDEVTSIGSVPAADGNWIATTGPHNYLLKAPTPNELCLACHDGQTFAPDVRGENTNSYVRQAGGLTTGVAPYEHYKGHTLGVRAAAPGGFGNLTLECITCHFHHGTDAYRNVDMITYAKETNDTTKDVFLRSFTLGDLANNYSIDNVDFNEPRTNGSQIGDFCSGCHFRFHGAAGDSNMGNGSIVDGTAWRRHPTADAEIGGVTIDDQHSSATHFASHPYRVKVMSPSGDWGTQGTAWTSPPNDLTPTCISCHKVHGNQNTFGLIFLAGSGPITEEGDAEGNAGAGGYQRERFLCGQCHIQ